MDKKKKVDPIVGTGWVMINDPRLFKTLPVTISVQFVVSPYKNKTKLRVSRLSNKVPFCVFFMFHKKCYSTTVCLFIQIKKKKRKNIYLYN